MYSTSWLSAWRTRLSCSLPSVEFEDLLQHRHRTSGRPICSRRRPNIASFVDVLETRTLLSADIVLTEVKAEADASLVVTYEIVDENVTAFEVGFYRSDDATFVTDELLDTVSITDAADLTVGTHTKTFAIGSGTEQVALPGAGIAETNVAYHLLAVADPSDAVAEDDVYPTTEDNTAVITGVYRGSTATLFVHGTVEADELSVVTDSNVTVILNGVTSVFTSDDVTAIRARMHAGDDTATGKPTPKPTFIDGGDGVDTLLGPDIAGIWKISELNTGSRSTAKFWSFESITGGDLDDTFKFVNSGSLSGEIDGGEGTNTLDYESLHSSIIVDLSVGSASRTGDVANIQNIFTGCGDDDVTGDEQDNIIRTGRGDDKADGGAGGYDIIVAGAGDDQVTGGPQRSILIGGGGKDCLRGGDEEDILIGNGTIHDNDIAALNALMAEWKRTDLSYEERISHLTGKTSDGANGETFLTPCTVYGGATRDKLDGGESLDWFWGTSCEVQDRQTDEVRSKGTKPVPRLGPFVHSIGCHVHSIVTATVRKLRRASCL